MTPDEMRKTADEYFDSAGEDLGNPDAAFDQLFGFLYCLVAELASRLDKIIEALETTNTLRKQIVTLASRGVITHDPLCQCGECMTPRETPDE